MNYLMLVNKEYGLSSTYIPSDLEIVENRKVDKPNITLMLESKTHKYFKKMIKAAKKDGFDIICDSGYRSYDYQKELFLDLLKKNKDTSKLALPGHSEHQSGLAVDIAAYQNEKYVDDPKRLKKEYEWLYKNSYKYGFILRYPECKEKITGYPFEAWHYRYVGKYAKIIMNKKITLEEFLDVMNSESSRNSKDG